MLIFFSMVAAGIILLSIVVFLHKMQAREKVESVDRTIPLPPLDGADKQRVLAIRDTINADFVEDDSPAEDSSLWLSQLLAEEDADSFSMKDWLAHSKMLAASNDFERALASCARAFPQMGAFRQSALLLRVRIRALRKSGAPCEKELDFLYRIAVWADLLHGKGAGHPAPLPAQLRRLDVRALEWLVLDYSQLGYRELTLLNATDRKLLVETRGEPSAHRRARELHAETLLRMISNRN